MTDSPQLNRWVRISRIYVGAIVAFMVFRSCALTEV